MIPERVIEVLHGPAVLQIGTRDDRLRPAHAIVVGAVAHADRETVTCLVPASRSDTVLSNLASNGRVALGVALVSHEAYQLKGRYLSCRPTGDEDIALQDAYRTKLLAAVRQVYPDEMARPFVLGMAYRPSVAITVRVEEVFLQTPGPGAGGRLA